MKQVNETYYHTETPDELVKVLEDLRQSKQRVIIHFGHVATGTEAYVERGTIGRSTGIQKIPLLVKTSRSLGGGALFSETILKITESTGKKRVLYSRACK
jgi:hypothetical protein